jgi:uncharacterized protein
VESEFMNTELISKVSQKLNINEKYVEVTLKLLEEGNTVPFIARYRKEATHGLDETQIRNISEEYEYVVNLNKKKNDYIRLIDEKGLLTDEIRKSIESATKLVELEDIYRPFKEKKKTKASDAIANGLEPLAKMIMAFPLDGSIDEMAKKFITDKVKTIEEAITGAKYIIAEWVSDNAYYRKYIRSFLFNEASIVTKIKKDAVDEKKVYEMYYDFKSELKYAKAYRTLAINRAEKESVINVSLEYDKNKVLDFLNSKTIRNPKSFVVPLVEEAIMDSYKRLIYPSVEREVRSELTEKAEVVAIQNFSDNLRNLLMQPPIKEKIVLGLDPAYRTGCKLAVLDRNGKVLEISKIFPHEPVNDKIGSEKIVVDLINKYDVEVIAIGNGTASRESEAFIADVIKNLSRKVEYIIVSEAGASVYSASKLAIAEFPTYHVEERSAVSIGRRLQDPLAELVKIDPESIGVGLYQHDVSAKNLKESLDFVVLSCVNSVGVDVNTASVSLFKYVSGITSKVAEKLIEYREKVKKIKSRVELKKILTPKVYEQAIGFLKINDGDNLLDETFIHPESYNIAEAILKHYNLSIKDIGTEKMNTIEAKASDYNTDDYTLNDIIDAFKKPKRDPRDELDKPILKSDITHIEDLHVGDKLQGTVRNVVDFGAFIDIGIKNDGLVHISKISKNYIKHPSEVLSVGDIVDVYVDKIELEKGKVSLTMLEP